MLARMIITVKNGIDQQVIGLKYGNGSENVV
jgi:hypothetical protein